MSKTKDRFVSIPWTSAAWGHIGLETALIDFLHYNKLRGIELKMTSHKQIKKIIVFSEVPTLIFLYFPVCR